MRGKGISGAGAGTSAGGTQDAAGALDAGWTLRMRQNRAPRLAVNAYNRYLISSIYVYIFIFYSWSHSQQS